MDKKYPFDIIILQMEKIMSVKFESHKQIVSKGGIRKMRNIKVHMYSKFLGEKSLAFLVFSYIGKAIINHHKRKIYNRQDMF